MNAKEFIKQYGWEKAKLVISEWNKYFNQYEVIKMPTHYNSDLEIFVHADDFKNLDDSNICIKDLKQLVDAWELIGWCGGLDKSKYIIRLIEGNIFVKDNIKREHTIDDLKKAIELVESVNE